MKEKEKEISGDGGTSDQKLHRVHLTKLLAKTKSGHGARRKNNRNRNLTTEVGWGGEKTHRVTADISQSKQKASVKLKRVKSHNIFFKKFYTNMSDEYRNTL